MNEIGIFFRAYGSSILIVVIGFFTLLTLFSMLGVNFNPVVNKEIMKVVTIEAFNIDENENAFCQKFATEPQKMNEQCKKLSIKSCSIPSCCVLLNGMSCVGGDKHGPTFHTENGVEKPFNYYHHKTTCYGNCPNN